MERPHRQHQEVNMLPFGVVDREPKKEQAAFQFQKARAELGKPLFLSQEDTSIIQGSLSQDWSLSTSDGVPLACFPYLFRGSPQAVAVPFTWNALPLDSLTFLKCWSNANFSKRSTQTTPFKTALHPSSLLPFHPSSLLPFHPDLPVPPYFTFNFSQSTDHILSYHIHYLFVMWFVYVVSLSPLASM